MLVLLTQHEAFGHDTRAKADDMSRKARIWHAPLAIQAESPSLHVQSAMEDMLNRRFSRTLCIYLPDMCRLAIKSQPGFKGENDCLPNGSSGYDSRDAGSSHPEQGEELFEGGVLVTNRKLPTGSVVVDNEKDRPSDRMRSGPRQILLSERK